MQRSYFIRTAKKARHSFKYTLNLPGPGGSTKVDAVMPSSYAESLFYLARCQYTDSSDRFSGADARRQHRVCEANSVHPSHVPEGVRGSFVGINGRSSVEFTR